MTKCVNEMNYYITQLLEISRENLKTEIVKEEWIINELVEEVLQG